MRGLGKWEYSVQIGKHPRLKTLGRILPRKSILFTKGPTSGSEESAAVHFARLSFLSFGDKKEKSDNDLTMVRTVETLSVVGSDGPTTSQEKEARSSGGIPSR